MNTLLTLLLAGALAASGTSGVNDPMAEERYRAKYGRYTPAEEARRQAAELAKRNTAPCCGHEGCCVRARKEMTVRTQVVYRGIGPQFAERFKAKYGRSPVDEATHAFGATTQIDAKTRRTGIEDESATRLQIKTGRSVKIAAVDTRTGARKGALVASALKHCEQECCSGK